MKNKLQQVLSLAILWDLLFLKGVINAELNTHLTLNFVLQNKRLKSTILRNFNNIEAHMCVVKCFSFHQKCRSINFNKSTKECELLGENIGFLDDSKFGHAVHWVHYGNRAVSYSLCFIYIRFI